MYKNTSQILTVINKKRYQQQQKYGQTVLELPKIRRILHDSCQVFQEQYVVCSSQFVNLTLLMTLGDFKFFEEHSNYLKEINKNDRGIINALIRDPNNFGIVGKSSQVVEKFNKYTENIYTNLSPFKRLRILADEYGIDYLVNKNYNLKTCFLLNKSIPIYHENEKFQVFVSSIQINDSLSLIMAVHFKHQVSFGQIIEKIEVISKTVSYKQQDNKPYEKFKKIIKIDKKVLNKQQKDGLKNSQNQEQINEQQLTFPLPQQRSFGQKLQSTVLDCPRYFQFLQCPQQKMKEDESLTSTETHNFLKNAIFDQQGSDEGFNLQGKCQGSINDPFDKSNFQCAYRNQGVQFCVDEKCQRHSVMCSKEDCKCKEIHDDCMDFKNIKAVKKSKKSNPNTAKIQKDLIEMINEVVFQVEGMISEMQNKLQDIVQFLGMSSTDKEFLQKIHSDKNSIEKDDNDTLKLTAKTVKEYLNAKEMSFEDCLKQTEEHILMETENTQRQCENQFKLLREKIISELIFNFQASLKQSKILKEAKDFNHMSEMLQQLKPMSEKLIFRATLNEMSIEQFYYKCENKPNLLYLVENEFGKKYGAYCPCPISINRLNKYETDESMSSFVFSLDLNKKAKVIQKENAIKNGHKTQNYQSLVSFGVSIPCSLVIGANSLSMKSNNWIQFHPPDCNSSYEESTNPPSKIECRGSQSSKCKLREVQVYQLILPQ